MDSLWQLIATLLVLLLGGGIALFYSGAVRDKNSLTLLMQSLVLMGITFLVWTSFGYQWVFSPEDNIDYIHMLYQWTFFFVATIVPLGAIAERVNPYSCIWFCALWGASVYLPIAKWVWGPEGWMAQMGAYDFAGGIVVHISSGTAGLVGAAMAGRRQDLYKLRFPFNLQNVFLGYFLIVLGWVGFNGGSYSEFGPITGHIVVNTLMAAVGGSLGWGLLEFLYPPRRMSLLGICFGGICGLVMITPGAYGLPLHIAFAGGLLCAWICFYFSHFLKKILRVDDALDVFSSHAVAGILGAFVVGAWGAETIVGSKALEANILSSFFTIGYSAVVSLFLILIIKKVFGFRVSHDDERKGLDIQWHGERSFHLGDSD